jgi:hypothetical protein
MNGRMLEYEINAAWFAASGIIWEGGRDVHPNGLITRY